MQAVSSPAGFVVSSLAGIVVSSPASIVVSSLAGAASERAMCEPCCL